MKKFCRILSVVCVIVVFATATIFIVKAVRKPRNKEIYATSVSFKSIAKAIEIYRNNEIIVGKDLVTIKPADCSVKPEFLFKKYGQSGETEIDGDTHKFENEGKYILICRVKSGADYYVEDRLTIDVVNSPRETTSFYIQKLNTSTLYVGENINLRQVAYIKRSNNSAVDVLSDEHIEYSDGVITPVKEGDFKITIVLLDNNIAICQQVSLKVKPSVINADVELKLTFDGNVLDSNLIEIELTPFNVDIGYTLTNLDENQVIDCWTDSGIVEVITFNAPTIRLHLRGKGVATVYVKPLQRPDLIFEIMITII